MALPAAAQGADIYVSPSGNDQWSGRLADPSRNDGPVATLKRASALLREQKAIAGARDKPWRVVLRQGTYFLDEPWTLGPGDSGTASAPVIFAAFPGERPIVSAGRRLANWQAAPGSGVWEHPLPEVLGDEWSFLQLHVDDARRLRPFLPKKGYFRTNLEVPPTEAAVGRGFDRFGFASGDIRPEWANSAEIEIVTFHNWSISRLRPGAIDAAAGIISLTGKTRENWYKLPKGTRYRVDNVREAFTEPGQFFLDRPGRKLLYRPLEGEDLQRSVIIAPRFEHALIIRPGTNHLRFEGLTFAHGNWVTPRRGSAFSFAATGMPALIAVAGAQNIVFDKLLVRSSSGFGIALGPGTKLATITNSDFIDLGAGGIEVGLGPASTSHAYRFSGPGDKTTANILIENNRIQGIGRVDPAGTGIVIANAQNNIIRNNEIKDTFYTGIQVGGTVGFGKSFTFGNFVSRNLIDDIGQGVLSDMGGVYTMGVSPNTFVSDNVIRNVRAHDYGGWGLYADEGSSGIVFERNLVQNTSHESFFLHAGEALTIRHNIFAGAGSTGALGLDPFDYKKAMTLRENLVLWPHSGPLFRGPWRTSEIIAERNIYGIGEGRDIRFSDGMTWAEWTNVLKQDAGARLTNPVPVDARTGLLNPASQADVFRQLGFPIFNTEQAGLARPRETPTLPPVIRVFE